MKKVYKLKLGLSQGNFLKDVFFRMSELAFAGKLDYNKSVHVGVLAAYKAR
jgi:hypothetical protein